MYKGVTTMELDELAAETAASMTSKHPDYALLAARISVSNLHKTTKKSSLLVGQQTQSESQGNLIFSKSRLANESKSQEQLSKKVSNYYQSKSFERLKSGHTQQPLVNARLNKKDGKTILPNELVPDASQKVIIADILPKRSDYEPHNDGGSLTNN